MSFTLIDDSITSAEQVVVLIIFGDVIRKFPAISRIGDILRIEGVRCSIFMGAYQLIGNIDKMNFEVFYRDSNGIVWDTSESHASSEAKCAVDNLNRWATKYLFNHSLLQKATSTFSIQDLHQNARYFAYPENSPLRADTNASLVNRSYLVCLVLGMEMDTVSSTSTSQLTRHLIVWDGSNEGVCDCRQADSIVSPCSFESIISALRLASVSATVLNDSAIPSEALELLLPQITELALTPHAPSMSTSGSSSSDGTTPTLRYASGPQLHGRAVRLQIVYDSFGTEELIASHNSLYQALEPGMWIRVRNLHLPDVHPSGLESDVVGIIGIDTQIGVLAAYYRYSSLLSVIPRDRWKN